MTGAFFCAVYKYSYLLISDVIAGFGKFRKCDITRSNAINHTQFSNVNKVVGKNGISR